MFFGVCAALMLLLLLDMLTVDRAVENIGFGWFQVKLSLFTGLVWVCNAFQSIQLLLVYCYHYCCL